MGKIIAVTIIGMILGGFSLLCTMVHYHGDEEPPRHVVALLTGLISVGISIASVLCLLLGKIEIAEKIADIIILLIAIMIACVSVIIINFEFSRNAKGEKEENAQSFRIILCLLACIASVIFLIVRISAFFR